MKKKSQNKEKNKSIRLSSVGQPASSTLEWRSDLSRALNTQPTLPSPPHTKIRKVSKFLKKFSLKSSHLIGEGSPSLCRKIPTRIPALHLPNHKPGLDSAAVGIFAGTWHLCYHRTSNWPEPAEASLLVFEFEWDPVFHHWPNPWLQPGVTRRFYRGQGYIAWGKHLYILYEPKYEAHLIYQLSLTALSGSSQL